MFSRDPDRPRLRHYGLRPRSQVVLVDDATGEAPGLTDRLIELARRLLP